MENNNQEPNPNQGGGRSNNTYKTIDEKLSKIKLALDGAYTDLAQTELAVFGYPKTELNVGMALYSEALTKNEKQRKEYGEQFEATDKFHSAKKTANTLYMKYLRLARIAFKNKRSETEALQLSGARKTAYPGWKQECRVFYNNLLGTQAYLDAIAKKGVTKAMLEDGLAKLVATENAFTDQNREHSEAVQSTTNRDVAFDAMETWFTDFKDTCMAVLSEKPQALNQMGF